MNAPRGFSTIWNVMKPWIAKETASKVSIHGSDYKSHLLELIDADALPAALGGSCTCAAHGGCMRSNAGPWMHARAERRKAWLRGERETVALRPGELRGEVAAPASAEKSSETGAEEEKAAVPQPEPESEKPEAQTEPSAPSEPPSTSVSGSMSETSSEEDESIATPPVSEGDLAGAGTGAGTGGRTYSSEVLEKTLGRITVQDEAETRQVQTGGLHGERTEIAAV